MIWGTWNCWIFVRFSLGFNFFSHFKRDGVCLSSCRIVCQSERRGCSLLSQLEPIIFPRLNYTLFKGFQGTNNLLLLLVKFQRKQTELSSRGERRFAHLKTVGRWSQLRIIIFKFDSWFGQIVPLNTVSSWSDQHAIYWLNWLFFSGAWRKNWRGVPTGVESLWQNFRFLFLHNNGELARVVQQLCFEWSWRPIQAKLVKPVLAVLRASENGFVLSAVLVWLSPLVVLE
jgi:hypothetical protein